MLSTLTRIGEQLLEGRGIWARLTAEPKFNPEKKNWVCPILFDCVNNDIQILTDQLQRFEPENSAIDFRYVNPGLWGPRGKKCALTVENKNFSMLKETLFGKETERQGSMQRAIEEFGDLLKETDLYQGIKEINQEFNSVVGALDLQQIKNKLDMGKDEEVVLFYSLIRSNRIVNGKAVKLTDLTGYEDFIISKFATPDESEEGLDYIKGTYSKASVSASFTGRDNINKVFQTTTSNYAAGFNNFSENFRAAPDTLAALDKSSAYVLKRWRTNIAGLSHIIIPNFLQKDLGDFDLEETELFIDRSSELLFRVHSVASNLDRELPPVEIFWVNYIAYESDGNSFKIINHIKDVNSVYLKEVIDVFSRTQVAFSRYLGNYDFNLQSIYRLVPVREGKKEKKNEVLLLFKDILEQRNVDIRRLYRHFVSLMNCHRRGQFADKGSHRAFPNIRKFDTFEYAAKDSVFKYLAFFSSLKRLNLTTMQNNRDSVVEQLQRQYPNKDIDEFLSLKNSNRNQIALFSLGRAVNAVAYAQERKGHSSRPILNKLNYNGMDVQEVMNLSRALMEKGTQYREVKTKKGKTYQVRMRVEDYLDLFNKYLDTESWKLSREETVFHIISGYVFRPSQTAQDNDTENQ